MVLYYYLIGFFLKPEGNRFHPVPNLIFDVRSKEMNIYKFTPACNVTQNVLIPGGAVGTAVMCMAFT